MIDPTINKVYHIARVLKQKQDKIEEENGIFNTPTLIDDLLWYAILEMKDAHIREIDLGKRSEYFEESEEQKSDWMYGIFDHDKIKEYKEQWTKEAEESGMTFTEYLESINPLKERSNIYE